MSDPKSSPAISWPTGPVIEPKSAEELRQQALRGEKDLVRESLDELDEIVRIAGGPPGQPSPAPAAPPPPPPTDTRSELDAYAELLKAFADNPEDGSVVTMLSADEFAADVFTPAGIQPKETPS